MDPVSFKEQYIPLSQGQIFVKQWRPGRPSTHVPLILLHDSLGCVEMWRDFPALLSHHTQRIVIAYDRLGFGKSSARKALPSPRFVSEEAEIYLPQLLQYLEIKEFCLFGHSVGGSMAAVAAGHLSTYCRAVITESSQAFVEDRTREGILKAKAEFENPKVFERLQKYHGDKTAWVLASWIHVWLSPEFAEWNLKEDLPRIKCPTLVLHGERDEYGSEKFPEMIAGLTGGPSQKILLKGMGHIPHRENSTLILKLISDFLNLQK